MWKKKHTERTAAKKSKKVEPAAKKAAPEEVCAPHFRGSHNTTPHLLILYRLTGQAGRGNQACGPGGAQGDQDSSSVSQEGRQSEPEAGMILLRLGSHPAMG